VRMGTSGPDSDRDVTPELPKRPWTTPHLVVHGTIPAQTFAAQSPLTKQLP